MSLPEVIICHNEWWVVYGLRGGQLGSTLSLYRLMIRFIGVGRVSIAALKRIYIWPDGRSSLILQLQGSYFE